MLHHSERTNLWLFGDNWYFTKETLSHMEILVRFLVYFIFRFTLQSKYRQLEDLTKIQMSNTKMNQYAVFIGQSPYFNYKEFMKELIDATKKREIDYRINIMEMQGI